MFKGNYMKDKKLVITLAFLCVFFAILYTNKFKTNTVYTFNQNFEKIDNNSENFKNNQKLNDLSIYNQENEQNNIININTADFETLKTLPNIGDKIANNIIDYRNSNGGFKNIEEIKNVDKIGEKIFQKIKHLITI